MSGFAPAQGQSATAVTTGAVQLALDGVSSTQGAILYRDASAWVALGPGTSGQVLQSGGAGANPAWATISTSQTLAQVLAVGNTTGANDIVVSSGQSILSATSLTIYSAGATLFLSDTGPPGTGRAYMSVEEHFEVIANSVSLVKFFATGQQFQDGAGAITHLKGPDDQNFKLAAGATRSVIINANSTLELYAGANSYIYNESTSDAINGTVDGTYIAAFFSDGGLNNTTVARGLMVNPSINYTGATRAGNYQAVTIKVNETSLPTGTNYLIRSFAGTTGTAERFSVNNAGKAWFTDTGTVPAGFSGSPFTSTTAMWSFDGGYPLRFYSAGTGAYAAMTLGNSRGTTASPTTVVTGDVVGQWDGQAYIGASTTYTTVARVRFLASGTITDTSSAPGAIVFQTTPNSSLTPTDVWGVSNAGKLTGVATASLGFAASTDPLAAPDTAVARQGAAGVLGVLNGSTTTNSAALRVYNTTDAATGAPTNSEYLTIDWSSNLCRIQTGATGSGTGRDLRIRSSGSDGGRIDIAANHNISFTSDGLFSFSGTAVYFQSGAKLASYLNVTTAGWGVPAIYASGRATAQTAANTSVATYTVGGSDGSFEISANVLVTTSTTHNFTVTVDYTDESNTARTLTLTFAQLTGTLLTAITNVTGAGPYEGLTHRIRCKASTAITVKTVGTFTTVTYNVEADVKQVS